MFWIGCHLSAAKGYLAMGKTAKRIGANTFQFFTRNPRGGSVKALDLEDIAAYRAFAKENGFGKILAHAPYTLNACAADARVLAFARQVMQEDLERLAHLPEAMYNFHPGSHVKQGEEIGIVKIADMLNCVLTEEIQTKVLLETMAGKGTEVGRTFEQLAAILARVERKEQMGVCLDTGSSVKIETLEKTWQTIINGIEQTKQIQQQAEQKRQQDTQRLNQLKAEFQNKMNTSL